MSKTFTLDSLGYELVVNKFGKNKPMVQHG